MMSIAKKLLPFVLMFVTACGSAAPVAPTLAPTAAAPAATIAPILAPATAAPPTALPTALPKPTEVAKPTDAPKPVATATPSGPTRIGGGNFYDLIHKGQGTATLSKNADGSFELALNNFKVESGPDLLVYLVSTDKVPKIEGNRALVQDALDLGKLQKLEGAQTYKIKAGTDLGKYKSVVIWCRLFAVTFIAAPITG